MTFSVPSAFQDVSRETIEKLRIYESLVRKWNPVINLVSRNTLDDLWSRHFQDSLDIFNLGNSKNGRWVDLGSGGGFPGAVAAILARDSMETRLTCIESDIRKCEFLRTVARATETPMHILSRRIEDAPPQDASILSARALAPLSKLLAMADRHMSPEGTAIFPKGETWKDEVEQAQRMWQFDLEAIPSSTNPKSAILRIGNIQRV